MGPLNKLLQGSKWQNKYEKKSTVRHQDFVEIIVNMNPSTFWFIKKSQFKKMHHFLAWKEYPVMFLLSTFHPGSRKSEAETITRFKNRVKVCVPRLWSVLSSTAIAITETRGTQLLASFLLPYFQVHLFAMRPLLTILPQFDTIRERLSLHLHWRGMCVWFPGWRRKMKRKTSKCGSVGLFQQISCWEMQPEVRYGFCLKSL